ncbi:MAG: hypothetical protein OHK0017_08900 [Patescibacteria group bacterium]
MSKKIEKLNSEPSVKDVASVIEITVNSVYESLGAQGRMSPAIKRALSELAKVGYCSTSLNEAIAIPIVNTINSNFNGHFTAHADPIARKFESNSTGEYYLKTYEVDFPAAYHDLGEYLAQKRIDDQHTPFPQKLNLLDQPLVRITIEVNKPTSYQKANRNLRSSFSALIGWILKE